jgi:hypothetical protein
MVNGDLPMKSRGFHVDPDTSLRSSVRPSPTVSFTVRI